MSHHSIRVLLLNLLLSGLVIALAAVALQLDRLWFAPLPDWLETVSWPFLILGTFLIVASVIHLIRFSGATGAPGDPTRKLVSEGPYKWIRNPIYAGNILLLFGAAFMATSLTLLVLAFLFIPSIDLYVRLVEEPRTERRLGENYREYKRRVPRWIPQIPRRNADRSEHTR
jgi:protein-S-isoprenylcysteine O-methyltransferase Ste14